MLTAEEIRNVIEKAEKHIEELQALLSTVEVEQEGRAKQGETYYYLDTAGGIDFAKELFDEIDDDLHGCGNYYLTKEDAIRAKKQIMLFRLLDRFSRQNGWTDEAWEDNKTDKWYIYFSYFSGNVCTTSKTCHRDICQVYFISESVAQQAIEKYHDLIMEVMAI